MGFPPVYSARRFYAGVLGFMQPLSLLRQMHPQTVGPHQCLQPSAIVQRRGTGGFAHSPTPCRQSVRR